MKTVLRILPFVCLFILLSSFRLSESKVIRTHLPESLPLIAKNIILTPAASKANKGCEVIDYAHQFLNIRYRHAGKSPKTGFDCSGFVNFVYKNFNYSLPTSSSSQAHVGEKIALKDVQPGDIILFKGSDSKSRSVGHVGIVVSENNQPIKFIHSATSQSRGITYDFLSHPYYKARFVSVRRILKK